MVDSVPQCFTFPPTKQTASTFQTKFPNKFSGVIGCNRTGIIHKLDALATYTFSGFEVMKFVGCSMEGSLLLLCLFSISPLLLLYPGERIMIDNTVTW